MINVMALMGDKYMTIIILPDFTKSNPALQTKSIYNDLFTKQIYENSPSPNKYSNKKYT